MGTEVLGGNPSYRKKKFLKDAKNKMEKIQIKKSKNKSKSQNEYKMI